MKKIFLIALGVISFNVMGQTQDDIISNGRLSLRNSSSTIGDILSLYQNRFNATDFYGLGVESGTMYYKTRSYHRWYSGTNADDGASAKMELSNTHLFVDGNVGIGLIPTKQFQIGNKGNNSAIYNDYIGTVNHMVFESKDSNNGGAFVFRGSQESGVKDLVSIDRLGKVGIGTPTPSAKLHVNYVTANGEISKNAITNSINTLTTSNVISYDTGLYSAINYNIPTGIKDLGYKIAINASSFSQSINFKGILNSNVGIWARAGIHKATPGAKMNSAIAVNAQVLDNVAGTTIDNIYGVKISTNDYKKSTVTNRYDLYAGTVAAKNYFAGKVCIGTTDPKGYDLAVAGNIVAEEIKVKLQASWPDYVFTKEYNLPTLKEVEKHITEKGHLQNIPSAKEVKENDGIELGKMNAKLLQKIEELTLYTIAQEKKITALEKDKERINELEKKMEFLLKNK